MCLAVPGKILSIEGDDPVLRAGKVDFGGVAEAGQPRLRARGAGRRLRARPRRLRHLHRGRGRGGAGLRATCKEMGELDELEDGERGDEVRRRIPRRGGRPRKFARGDAPASPPGPGRSWRSAAGRRTPSSSSASTSCCRRQITLVHGPGCPVCVTPLELIDKALAIAARPGRDLLLVRRHAARARHAQRPAVASRPRGGDVRIVYSPLDAVELARENPDARGRLLRRRLRDHRAGQRDGGVPGARSRA